ncbi:MAG: hypothetical protein K0Q50_232 [Vampirovibrio sp.]|jgi:hypothetical protein|nr:hypothetical protein [Vampirovibrio sp.]
MELEDLRREFKQIADEHILMFAHKPLEGGSKLEKLISKAFIAGLRKAKKNSKE